MRAKCILALILICAVAGRAATAEAGIVKVRSVSAPRSATAGASTDVTVAIARRGAHSRECNQLLQRVSPSGALEGTASPWQGSDVTANYKWKLVPQE